MGHGSRGPAFRYVKATTLLRALALTGMSASSDVGVAVSIEPLATAAPTSARLRGS